MDTQSAGGSREPPATRKWQCRSRLATSSWPERRWDGRCTWWPRSRLCHSNRCIEGFRLDSAVERFHCIRRVLCRLACDIHMWQAVVAVGIEVHLWRLEVQLRRPVLVRAQLRPASLRVAAHRLCPAECRRQLLRCRQLHIPHTAVRSTCCCTDPRGRPPSPP